MMMILLQSSGNREVVSVFFQRRLHESFQFFLSCLPEEEALYKRNTEKNNRCKRRNQHDFLYFGYLHLSSSFCFSHTVRRSALHIAIIPSADAIRMHTINSKTFILSISLQIDCVQTLVFVELIVIICITFIRWAVIRTIVFVRAEKAAAGFRILPGKTEYGFVYS